MNYQGPPTAIAISDKGWAWATMEGMNELLAFAPLPKGSEMQWQGHIMRYDGSSLEVKNSTGNATIIISGVPGTAQGSGLNLKVEDLKERR